MDARVPLLSFFGMLAAFATWSARNSGEMMVGATLMLSRKDRPRTFQIALVARAAVALFAFALAAAAALGW